MAIFPWDSCFAISLFMMTSIWWPRRCPEHGLHGERHCYVGRWSPKSRAASGFSVLLVPPVAPGCWIGLSLRKRMAFVKMFQRNADEISFDWQIPASGAGSAV